VTGLAPAVPYNCRMHPPIRAPIRTAAAAAAAALALLAGGCGGSSAPRARTTAGSAAHGFEADAFKFAACMRAHGLSGFPDPQVSSSGSEVRIRIGTGTINPNAPAFTAATQACHGLLPDGGKLPRSQQQINTQLGGLVAFAQCMRHRGVANFPDPTAQGQLSVQMVQNAGIDLQSRAIDADAYACAPASRGVLTRADIARSLHDAAGG